MLFAVAAATLGDRSEAQDCVHDAMLRVWARSDSYRPERGALRSFLIVCVRNEAISRKRTAARRNEIERQVVQAAPSSSELEASDPIERAQVRSILAELPDDQRRPLELAYFGERTQSEIARELGIPLGTVKSRISLAMRKLQARLGVRREKL